MVTQHQPTENDHHEICRTPQEPRRPCNPKSARGLIDANWDKTGLTNEQGAARFGFVAPNMISHWRTGRTPVSLAHLSTLAALLGADEASLFVLWLKQQRLRDKTIPANGREAISGQSTMRTAL